LNLKPWFVFKAHRLFVSLNSSLESNKEEKQKVAPGESPEGVSSLLSSQFENNYFTEMCSGSEEGSYLRLIQLALLKQRG